MLFSSHAGVMKLYASLSFLRHFLKFTDTVNQVVIIFVETMIY